MLCRTILFPEKTAQNADPNRYTRDDRGAEQTGYRSTRRALAVGERVIRQESRLFLNGRRRIGSTASDAEAILIQRHILTVAGLGISKQSSLKTVRIGAGEQG